MGRKDLSDFWMDGEVPQEERDIIEVRNDICGIAGLARIVEGCGGPSAECWKELSRF